MFTDCFYRQGILGHTIKQRQIFNSNRAKRILTWTIFFSRMKFFHERLYCFLMFFSDSLKLASIYFVSLSVLKFSGSVNNLSSPLLKNHLKAYDVTKNV